jgi:hypothetical protein
LDNSSMISDRTPMPEVNSSSFENSTPMALPKGQLDSGNVLTLREQEAVSIYASVGHANTDCSTRNWRRLTRRILA